MVLGYVRSDDPGCMLIGHRHDEIVIRIDAASIRRSGSRLDPYFGTVIRDLVAGIGVAVSDLRRCAILNDDLITEAEMLAQSRQGSLPIFAAEPQEFQGTLFD